MRVSGILFLCQFFVHFEQFGFRSAHILKITDSIRAIIFDRWDEIFTDKIIAAAIVDRLTFKSFIIDMNGPSYRLKATEQWINERKNTDKKAK